MEYRIQIICTIGASMMFTHTLNTIIYVCMYVGIFYININIYTQRHSPTML